MPDKFEGWLCCPNCMGLTYYRSCKAQQTGEYVRCSYSNCTTHRSWEYLKCKYCGKHSTLWVKEGETPCLISNMPCEKCGRDDMELFFDGRCVDCHCEEKEDGE